MGCILLICSPSRICSFCLLFWCSNIIVFSVRIFRNSVVGNECFFFKMLCYWTCIREITNYERFINQFLLNMIRSIRQFERINKIYVDIKCLLCSIKITTPQQTKAIDYKKKSKSLKACLTENNLQFSNSNDQTSICPWVLSNEY